ncbi:hypothetical protein Celaphus_00016139, partial [Cervus elaphus hippelaphus]
LGFPVLGARGAVSAGGLGLGGSGLQRPLQAALLHRPAVLAQSWRPAHGPGSQERPLQGLRGPARAYLSPVPRGRRLRLPPPQTRGHLPRSAPGGSRAVPLPAWLSALCDQCPCLAPLRLGPTTSPPLGLQPCPRGCPAGLPRAMPTLSSCRPPAAGETAGWASLAGTLCSA